MIWPKYWRYLAVLGILVAAFVWLKYWGHTKYEAGKDAAEARMAIAVTEQRSRVLEKESQDKARQELAVKHFHDELAIKDSIANGLARRLHDHEVRSRAMSEATANAGGAPSPGGVTGSDEEIGRAAEEVNQACRRDAARLDLAREAWPQ